MTGRVKKGIKSCCKIMLFIVGFFLCPLEADAEADFSDYTSVRHPLIQATDVVEEYEGLEALGFLDTGKWDNNLEPSVTEQSEYGALLQSLQRENAYEKARASIVQINMGAYYGSGVIWDLQDENIILVSNAHLLQNGEKGLVTFGNGVSVEATVM